VVLHLFDFSVDIGKYALVVCGIISRVWCSWRRAGEEWQVMLGCVARVEINRADIQWPALLLHLVNCGSYFNKC